MTTLDVVAVLETIARYFPDARMNRDQAEALAAVCNTPSPIGGERFTAIIRDHLTRSSWLDVSKVAAAVRLARTDAAHRARLDASVAAVKPEPIRGSPAAASWFSSLSADEFARLRAAFVARYGRFGEAAVPADRAACAARPSAIHMLWSAEQTGDRGRIHYTSAAKT